MSPSRATLRIPGTPPSFNAVGYRSHWAVGQRAKKQWEGWLYLALIEQRVPRGLSSVKAMATIRFKQRRRRDAGNFKVILDKALGDALQSGWIEDDTPEFYEFGAVELVAPCSEPQTLVHLTYTTK